MARPTLQCHPWFDASGAPIYGFQFPRAMQDAELELYCEWLASWYAAQVGTVGMICDMSRSLIISARQRQIWIAFERRAETALKRVLAGVAIVVTNSVMQGVVTAAYWMKPPVYHYQLVSTRAEGRDWLQTLLTRSR